MGDRQVEEEEEVFQNEVRGGGSSWVAASERRKRERSRISSMRQNATKAPGAPTPGTRKSAGMICPGGLRSAPGVAGLATS